MESVRSLTRGTFVHGVASGDPTSEGIILWTRVTPTGRDRGEKDHSPDISFPVTWVVSTSAPKSKRMTTTTTTTTKQGHGLLSIHMRTRYSLDFRL